ncbi:MAG: 30S ribosomal protein S6 [Leptospiraceae bacterium]|nr:30S ribosomal protein S6 [Leptospiraceae bacterium]MDW7976726.1 30S ribosomal protein S6 [Leptospiraceae bacterium]
MMTHYREYELVVILSPELSIEQAKETLEEIFQEFQVKNLNLDIKGRQDLQYERRKFTSGIYVFGDFIMDKNKTSELKFKLQTHPKILQFYLKKSSKKKDIIQKKSN